MALNPVISTEHLDDPNSDIEHLYDPDSDIELGQLGSSAINLIEPDPATPAVEKKTSVSSSSHSSVGNTRKLFLRGICQTYKLLKTLLSNAKPFIVVMLYALLGANLFLWIEVPNNLNDKQEALENHLKARDELLSRLILIYQYDGEKREDHWQEAVIDFENAIGAQEPSLDTDWTFWMSFLYAGSIFTTLGNEKIACKTVTGQLVTIFYAMLGIPLLLIVLNDLSKKLLKFVKKLSDFIGDIILFIGLRVGVYKPDPSNPPRFHLSALSRKAVNIGIFSAAVDGSDLGSSESIKNDDDDIEANPSIVVAFIFTISWLLLCAAIFCIWEDWTYWTSIYYFFISFSTIGFSGVSPADPEHMFATYGLVLIGLALVSVCINVVQGKLNQLYMAVLEKLLEDYKKAIEKGDQTAAVKGMMGGFQDQAKYLMPLISESQGAKVMGHFKELAKAKGIELPPVLTNLDPKTGMPAFAKAKVQEFKQYIEKANEQAKPPPEVISVEVQTEADAETTVYPIELAKPSISASLTQNELRTATVQSQTTDLIRMVNAQIEALIFAESTESSTQVEQIALIDMETEIDFATATKPRIQVELVQVEVAAEVYQDL